MILADTSAWVEFDRATGSTVDGRMSGLVAGDGPLAVTDPVMMEVLAGAKSRTGEVDLRRLLLRFEQRPFEVPGDFDAAIRIYRRCRGAGVTPRGLVDCMITAVAWRSDDALLTYDVDLHRVANVVGVELDAASLPA